jgi:hypothetical protein
LRIWGTAPVERNEDQKKIRHAITMWRNGFTVDDGPLRRTVRVPLCVCACV